MTDIASLQIEIDATDAKEATAALDKLTAASARTEKAANKLAIEQAKASQSSNRVAIEEAKAAAAASRLAIEQAKASVAAERLAASQNKAANAAKGATVSAGQQRAGMQQLSFQIGDVGQQFALGTRPMTIFAQQGGQVIQALGMMTNSSKGLIGFLAGPWGQIITASVIVLGSLAAAMGASSDKADDASQSAEDMAGSFDYAKTATTALIAALGELATAQARQNEVGRQSAIVAYDEAKANLNAAAATRKKIIANLEAAKARQNEGALDAAYGSTPAQRESQRLEAEIALQDAEIRELGKLAAARFIPATQQLYNDPAGAAADRELAALNKEYASHKLITAEIKKQYEIRYAEIMDRKKAALENEKPHKAKKDAAPKMSEAQKEYNQAIEAAERYNDTLREQTAQIGKTNIEIKRMGAVSEATAAYTAALVAPTKEEADALRQQADAIMVNYEAWKARTEALEANIAASKTIQSTLKKTQDWLEKGREKALEREQARLDGINSSLLDMIGLLNRIGGAGGVLGSILAITSGNYNSVAGGPLGDLIAATLRIPTGKTTKSADGKVIAEVLGDKLKTVFGKNGLFGQTLAETLQNAGLGMSGASAILGQQGTAGAIGSAIGGVIGDSAGKRFLKFLGDAAGPIGSIIGGVLGGLFGGLFGSSKWGTASSTGASGGNKAAFASAAGNALSSVTSALEQISGQLGATLGGFSTSIGIVDDKWRVSTTGRSGKLKTKFGDVTDFGKGDAGAAAALKYAIADAIRDGALVGLRASTKNLLLAGGDIEAQLKKAAAFEGVFDELESAADPVKFQLDQLAKQFLQLERIFSEAGATTEELAKLQELRTTKEAEIAKEAGRSWRQAADELREYRAGLYGNKGGTNASLVKLITTGSLAAAGDQDAMGKLPGVGDEYLSAARASAGSMAQYQRSVALVARYTDKAIAAADSKASMPYQQLQALNGIDKGVAAMAGKVEQLNAQMDYQTTAINNLRTYWERFTRDGTSLVITTDDDSPISTVAA